MVHAVARLSRRVLYNQNATTGHDKRASVATQFICVPFINAQVQSGGA